ncbi:mbp-1 interacting protein-2a family protein [Toxoplasma gondii TgCatPRC2]|uniref:Mbp-1 interacting protein-2a family protein n=15 Tax=Toxoplasma gondii TaxID=5811 RepID=A0A125YKI3_TOXGV|nr:mbp-1 interacting protein-2a family protein [Toxoplasma gondii ME49]EPR58439.1 mbp-1 interacting protein-2a family protein [Toxoplasma gondii GT1]ESS29997.1 mbp-1 interacting protein-2a family protein [Toxoplasma gondii VEG]KAF4645674.1 mbp-1 interacting protein-2a family protein [Toxoplasma gondii]KFG35970.1 mbp-1 interacting protein-2a family protein [Toxoplasma gondii p89]KFG41765.1 mbp-1 interacting protein-2a family protein [Toxoplasma gondii GAB2-2007-GAL-DOM2]KFG47942.1 mbp-1 intera|eukprot:XP_002370079.1 mbp-1 interacting protein-2a family protein [Toxoplasma gondii ME49]
MSTTSSVFVLVIVGKGDTPLYEADLSSPGKREDSPHYDQFIIHQALDAVDECVWQTQSMYLKNCDSFRDFLVSAYCTAGHVKFLLLHKNRGSNEGIKNFFSDVHELFLRVLINPLYEVNGLITSQSFDQLVRAAAKKHLH